MWLAIVSLSILLGFTVLRSYERPWSFALCKWWPRSRDQQSRHAECRGDSFHKRNRLFASNAASHTSGDITALTLSTYHPQIRPKRVIVAMTGATGAILGVEILKALSRLRIETHLILSHWALETLRYETEYSPSQMRRLATRSYNVNDASAPPSSGSFQTDGMIIVPCSMKTLSAIRHGYGADLIARSADVNIKEQRKLVVCVRETPLSTVHLENMLGLSRLPGVVIFPPVPAFYTRPQSINDIIKQTVGRMIDALGFDCGGFERWGEDHKRGDSKLGSDSTNTAAESASGSAENVE